MPFGFGDLGISEFGKSFQSLGFSQYSAGGDGNRYPAKTAEYEPQAQDEVTRITAPVEPPVVNNAEPLTGANLGPVVPLPVALEPLYQAPEIPSAVASNPAPVANSTALVPLLDQNVPMPILVNGGSVEPVLNADGAARGEASVATSSGEQISAMLPILLIAGTAAMLILVK